MSKGAPNGRRPVDLGGGLKLWQDERFFGFSEDAARLSEFAADFCQEFYPSAERICELGSGNGGLLLTLAARLPQVEALGVEVMAANVELANMSLAQNAGLYNLGERVRFIREDWRNLGAAQIKGCEMVGFDLVVSNPPFWQKGTGRLSPTPERRAATHELHGGLREMLLAACGLLKCGGGLCVILPKERACELGSRLAELGFVTVREAESAERVLIGARLLQYKKK